LSIDTGQGETEFGANEWLIEEMYEQYKANPDAVDKSWWPILERYHVTLGHKNPVAVTANHPPHLGHPEQTPLFATVSAPFNPSNSAQEPLPTVPVSVAAAAPNQNATVTSFDEINKPQSAPFLPQNTQPAAPLHVSEQPHVVAPAAEAPAAAAPAAPVAADSAAPMVAKTTRVEARPAPIPAQAPATAAVNIVDGAAAEEPQDEVVVLRHA